jgi:RND family efflux transporter MFP subunit
MTTFHHFGRPIQWISAVTFIFLLIGCGSGSKDKPPTDSAAAGSNIIPVEVASVLRQNLSVTKTFSGTLEGEEQANITAKLSERVTGIKVRVGEQTGAGGVILTLDKSGVTSQYYQAEAGFKNAAKTLERMKSLFSEGAISQQTLDGTQTQYDVAKANFDAARSAVELTTPISGVVTAINASIGDLTVPGAILATVARVGRLKMTININETDVTNLTVGQTVQIFTESKPDAVAEGRITQLSKSADVKSRTFEIKVMFPNTRDRWFKPGMYCKARIQVSPRTKTLVVPNTAIQSDGMTSRVFIARNGRSYQRAVQVGISDEDVSEILSGLTDNDTVITTGATTARDSGYISIANRSK